MKKQKKVITDRLLGIVGRVQSITMRQSKDLVEPDPRVYGAFRNSVPFVGNRPKGPPKGVVKYRDARASTLRCVASVLLVLAPVVVGGGVGV